MVVIFDEEVKNILKQVGKEQLKPVTCLGDAKKFHHYKVLRRNKTGASLFWEQPAVPAEFSVLDILDPSSPSPVPFIDGPFIYKDKTVTKEGGDLTVDTDMRFKVGASLDKKESHESILKFQINEITTEIWTDLLSRKLKTKEPWFLKECREKKQNLYVVSETVEVTNSPELLFQNDVKWLGKFSIPRISCVTGEAEVHSDKERQRSLTLPERVVMAYQKKQLVITKDGWRILLIKDKKQRTFPDEPYPVPRVGTRKIDERDFKQLQVEISKRMRELSQLPKDVQDALLHNISTMLGDRGALQDFWDLMNGYSKDNLDDSVGIIIKEVRKNEETNPYYPQFCIPYLLEALMVLNDTQHDLLVWSMEKKILLHQRELMRSILEPNFKHTSTIPFTFQPELLTPLQDEGVAVTYDLLAQCGLNIDRNNNSSAWDPEAKMPLSALYGCISLLQLLIEA